MRLRRETGDFQIVVKPGEEEGTYVANSIRPGLSAEDLIGEVIEFSTGLMAVITCASAGSDDFVHGAFSADGVEGAIHYKSTTGAITVTIAGS